MTTDTIRLEAPAAQKELEFLRGAKVGDVRESKLFPSLDCDIEWKCMFHSKDGRSGWDARVMGQFLMKVTVEEKNGVLVLVEKE